MIHSPPSFNLLLNSHIRVVVPENFIFTANSPCKKNIFLFSFLRVNDFLRISGNSLSPYVLSQGTMRVITWDYVVAGLFSYSHMEFEADRDRSPEGDPSLAEMTRTALSVLTKNPRGFFLFIESTLKPYHIAKL